MQNIDNDMDDLFKKAAENYPLKIQPGNFDTVLPFIGNNPADISNTHRTTKSGKRSLKFAVAICLLVVSSMLLIQTKKEPTGVKSVVDVFRNVSADGESVSAKARKEQLKNPEHKNSKNQVLVDPTIARLKNNERHETFLGQMKPSVSPPNYHSLTNSEKEIASGEIPLEMVVAENDRIQGDLKRVSIVKKDEWRLQDKIDTKEMIPAIVNEKYSTLLSGLPLKKKQTPGPSLYYGLVAGLELNSVKSQAVNQTTFNGGVTVGVQITKRLALESAVLFSQKKYYSDGKYFKPKAGSMPANMVIRSLQSKNNLIELPIAVKFNFNRNTNGFYSKLGVSSYLLTRESNRYNALVSGQEQYINSSYKTNHRYLASSVRFSLGYQKQYSKTIKLRIEPYLQIPTKGMGVGSMSVTSAGVQLILSNK